MSGKRGKDTRSMTTYNVTGPGNAEQDAEFIKSLADCLTEADRFASPDGTETYVMLTEPMVQVIVEGLRIVYKRSLTH